MFDLSFFEIAIILVVAFIVIKPEDMPSILRSIGRGIRKIKNISKEFTGILDDVSNEVGDVKKIIGDDGKEYPSYDLKDSNKDK